MPKYWTASEVLTCKEPGKAQRGTFPRFLVKADGITTEFKTISSLDKFLGCIYSTSPRVFVNAGKGITIDFDTHN